MSESNYTVGLIAERIASKIGMCWPIDAERIFENLSHVQDEIWETGKFYGSTNFFYCNITPDKQLITPDGYSILLGLDLNARPVPIKDKHFLFHENGPGNLLHYLSLNKLFREVYSLGPSPVLRQPTDEKCDTEPKYIVVKSECASDDPPYKYTQISGVDCKGNRIYSYNAEDQTTGKETICQCAQVPESDHITVVDGVKFPISNMPRIAKNIKFSRITNIIKEVTETPVEYYAVDKNGNGTLIARLEPWEIFSRYNRYQVPKNCEKFCSVLGLFKKTKPPLIQSEEQLFLSNNLSAIMSMCIAVDYKYEKKDLQKAAPFFQAAASHLNAELKENQGTIRSTLQVDAQSGFQNFPRM